MPLYILSLITVMFVAPTNAQHRSTGKNFFRVNVGSLNLFTAFKGIRNYVMVHLFGDCHASLLRVHG